MGRYADAAVEKDEKQANEWFRKCAEQGEPICQDNLGASYMQGLGVEKDFPTAKNWFESAAQKNYLPAMYKLGRLYLLGDAGLKQNAAAANDWFEKCAGLGDASCQYELAVSYQKGRGMKQDRAKARDWFEKAPSPRDDCNVRLVGQDGISMIVYSKEHSYLLLNERIKKATAQSLPKEAYRIAGTPVLTLTLLDDGTVDRVEMTRSSGNKAIDEALIASIDAAAPFPQNLVHIEPGEEKFSFTIQ